MMNKINLNNIDFIFASRYEKNAGSEDDTIVTLDGDGQNDPKDINSMLKVWEDNNENSYLLVIGHRRNRQDNWSRRYASLMAKRFRKFK